MCVSGPGGGRRASRARHRGAGERAGAGGWARGDAAPGARRKKAELLTLTACYECRISEAGVRHGGSPSPLTISQKTSFSLLFCGLRVRISTTRTRYTAQVTVLVCKDSSSTCLLMGLRLCGGPPDLTLALPLLPNCNDRTTVPLPW